MNEQLYDLTFAKVFNYKWVNLLTTISEGGVSNQVTS